MTLRAFLHPRLLGSWGVLLVAVLSALGVLSPILAQPTFANERQPDLLVLAATDARFSTLATTTQDTKLGISMFGNPGDQPLMGDWNCNGVATPGVYRTQDGRVFISNSPSGGRADVSFYFGEPGDIALAGDFNGNGCETVAVYRPASSTFYVRNSLTSGTGEIAFPFGNPGDQPFAGDFDGDSRDTFGVYRSNGRVYLGNDLRASKAQTVFLYGNPGDQMFAGDWSHNGVDSVGVYRPSSGRLYLRDTGESLYVGANVVAMAATAVASGGTGSGYLPGVTAPATPTTPSSPPPADRHIDVELWPGDALRSIVREASADTVFRINGTHVGQSIEPNDGQVFVGAPGAVLRGNGAEYAFRGEGKNVVVEGLEITGYDSPAQKGAIQASGSGWVIRENEIHHNSAVGIKYSHADNAIIDGNNIHHNGQLGIGVAYSTGTVVENNEIAYNNYEVAYSWEWEAGGTKFWKTVDLTVRGNYSHDNHGPGLWDDKNNYNILYEDNLVEDNYANGIFHEIGYKATIRNNTVRRNGFGHDSWLWGAGILIASSRDTEVYGNLVEGNFNGITMTQQVRGDGDRGPHVVQDNWVHDNRIINSGISGAARDTSSDAIYDANNRFTGNDYVGANRWKWESGIESWGAWQGLGFDQDGSYVP